MKTILAILFLLGTIAAAQARLGETRQQCIDRYGNDFLAHPDRPDTVRFTKAGFAIFISFDENDVADYLMFSKTEPFQDISEEEIQTILTANFTGEFTYEEDGIDRAWRSKDGNFVAAHGGSNGVLYIASSKGIKRAAEKTAEQERQNLSGF